MAKFIYQQIAHDIIAAIESGVLHHGDKLESVRKLAAKHDIGVSTATQVYRKLEQLGWIIAVEKKGYFVDRPTTIDNKSYGNSLISSNELCQLPLVSAVQYSFSSSNILPLSCTSPSSVVDTEAWLNKAHRKALFARPYRIQNHNPIDTSLRLRQEIAKHFLKSGHLVLTEEILMTNSRNDGLLIALQACKLFKNRVAIESPCSLFYQSILNQYQIDSISIPMQSDFSDELKLLEEAYIASPFSAYLFNPNYNDPTGRALENNDKRQLIQWAQQRDVALIEYDRGELYFSAQRPAPITCLVDDDSTNIVISIADFYDTISDRLGMGYMIVKNGFDACVFSQQATGEYPIVSTLNMALEIFQNGKYQTIVNKIREQLASQCLGSRRIFQRVLKDEIKSELFYLNDPNGGPCLWLGLPKGKSSHVLWQRLIKQEIAIAPGGMFIKQQEFERFFRITFGLPWDEKMQQGIETLAHEIKTYIRE